MADEGAHYDCRDEPDDEQQLAQQSADYQHQEEGHERDDDDTAEEGHAEEDDNLAEGHAKEEHDGAADDDIEGRDDLAEEGCDDTAEGRDDLADEDDDLADEGNSGLSGTALPTIPELPRITSNSEGEEESDQSEAGSGQDDYSTEDNDSMWSTDQESEESVEATPLMEGPVGGYCYEFVVEPSSAFHCPICTYVARGPYQANCCGKVFCERCLYRLWQVRLQSRQKFTCPNCRSNLNNLADEKVFKDTKTNRDILELEVYCTERKSGCEWRGSLSSISEHVVNCPKRKFMCVHCRLVGPYEDIAGPHYIVCPSVIEECPHEGCTSPVKRCDMASHKLDCAHRILPCSYRSVGCNAEVKQKNLMFHESKRVNVHLKMAVDKIKEQDQAIQENMKLLCKLKLHIQRLEQDASSSEHVIRKLTNFSNLKSKSADWESIPFSTSAGGYSMCLSVCPNGTEEGAGTHLSCYISIVPGAHDDTLEWPFCGEVCVELLNQLQDKDHHRCVIVFDDTTPLEYRGRVRGAEWGEELGQQWGEPQYLAHHRLSHQPERECQYLKNDALFFRLSATVRSSTKPWLYGVRESHHEPRQGSMVLTRTSLMPQPDAIDQLGIRTPYQYLYPRQPVHVMYQPHPQHLARNSTVAHPTVTQY